MIDTAKAIGLGVEDNGDVWDFYNGSRRPQKMAKVGVVLTIPAAGSESSDGSVITNEETKEKLSCCTDFMYPDFAILNPSCVIQCLSARSGQAAQASWPILWNGILCLTIIMMYLTGSVRLPWKP